MFAPGSLADAAHLRAAAAPECAHADPLIDLGERKELAAPALSLLRSMSFAADSQAWGLKCSTLDLH